MNSPFNVGHTIQSASGQKYKVIEVRHDCIIVQVIGSGYKTPIVNYENYKLVDTKLHKALL